MKCGHFQFVGGECEGVRTTGCSFGFEKREILIERRNDERAGVAMPSCAGYHARLHSPFAFCCRRDDRQTDADVQQETPGRDHDRADRNHLRSGGPGLTSELLIQDKLVCEQCSIMKNTGNCSGIRGVKNICARGARGTFEARGGKNESDSSCTWAMSMQSVERWLASMCLV